MIVKKEYLLLNTLLDDIDATIEAGRELGVDHVHEQDSKFLATGMLALGCVREWAEGCLHDIVREQASE
jgi:hypothetical protein